VQPTPTEGIFTILFAPFRMLSQRKPANPFQRSKQKDDQSDQQILSSTIVQSVSAPKSELLTPDDITQCAKESNLIGGTLTPETLEMTAKKINNLYLEQGYVMNCVTGATLVPPAQHSEHHGSEGNVELKVREVKLAKPQNRNSSSVRIRFVEKLHDEAEKGDGASSQSDQQTYKIVSGRTRPSKIARMVKQVPGSHFQILPERWSQLATYPARGVVGGDGRVGGRKSAIFSTIHAVRPIPTSQDTVELEIVATENKPLSLEYGVTKSLYSDQWEGELDLKHTNIFGGGEVATINVRKGRSIVPDNVPGKKGWKNIVSHRPISWKMSIQDDYFGGRDAGYDFEVFRDYVGVGGNDGVIEQEIDEFPDGNALETKQRKSSEKSGPPLTGAMLKLRLRQPFHPFLVPKAISARFECVDRFTMNDTAQCMASVSTNFGPYHKSVELLTRPIRSSFSAISTFGRKWNVGAMLENGSGDANSLLYAAGTITTMQSMPLSSERRSVPSTDLILRHVVSASTTHLPRHEAITLGLASRIRGYRYNYQLSSMKQPQQNTRDRREKGILQSLKTFLKGDDRDQFLSPIALSKVISGTVEVRLPFERVVQQPFVGSGTVVVFGDWCVAQAQQLSSSTTSPPGETGDFEQPFRQSSIGIGLRKVVQGIPLKMDACVTEHGTKGLFFGIGNN
jgi:outer membrane protein assembly factor BamA